MIVEMRAFTSLVGSIVVASVVALVAVGACSPDHAEGAPDAAPPSLDAGAVDHPSSVSDAAPEASVRPTCNDVSLVGVPAGIARGWDRDPPAPTGGSVADGSYVFTEAAYYALPLFPTTPLMRSKMIITGSTIQYAEGPPDPDPTDPDRTFTDKLAVSPTWLTRTETCPTPDTPKMIDFSVGVSPDGGAADAGTLTLYVKDKGMTTALVFVRQ
jgi:hypothetical protein